ncbi:MAG: hypothetical protein ABL308_01500 [Oceanicaulis sp.]
MAKIKLIFVSLGLILLGGCAFVGTFASGLGEDRLDPSSWKLYALAVSALTSAAGLVLSIWSTLFAPPGVTLGEFLKRDAKVRKRLDAIDWTVTEEATQTRAAVREDGDATRETVAAMEQRIIASIQRASDRPLGADETRSITEAVERIFASKDARKRPIQVALSENRIDDAAAQLEGLARQSEAAKDDFAREAAENFREAGALWLGRNTGRALKNFEHARDNDPDHFWTRIELSRLYALAGRTADALIEAEHASGLADSDRDRSVALDARGDMLRAQGRTGAALTAYEEGLAIARDLAAADPDSAEARRDVSVSLEKVGDMLAAQGRTGEALNAYEEGLNLCRDLAASDPDSAGARRDVSVSLSKVGDMLAAQGRTGEALNAYEEGLNLCRDLAAGDPDSAGARRDVSVSLNKVGDMLAAQGRTGEALKAYEEDLGLARDLAAGDPDSAGARRDVIVSLVKIGSLIDPPTDMPYWREAHERAVAMERDGILFEPDHWLIEYTRRKAGGEAET